MILAPRWAKLARDFRSAQGRIALMITALAIGLFALTTISTAYAILGREISRNYLATNPASALIDVGTVTPAILAAVTADPEIAAAEPASIIVARAQDRAGNWQRALLFVFPDPGTTRIGRVLAPLGQSPAPDGSIDVEREALNFLGATPGQRLTVELPGHKPVALPIASAVHDPSLAPAWQEQTAYLYLSPQTLAALGGGTGLELVKVIVRDAPFDQARTDAVVGALAQRLRAQGIAIHQIQIPPTGQHPHQSQMTGVLTMFLTFAALALLLSAVLTATMVAALLAQQVRQIAIMKAIGATTGQVAALYLSGIAIIAVLATAIALPLGLWAGGGFAGVIAELLNFDLATTMVPLWLLASLAALGLVLPLLCAAVPIRRATRATVREALTDQGVTPGAAGGGVIERLLGRFSGLDRTLLLALRNAFRKRGRLLLNLALLGAAGAMFIAALDVEAAWRGQLDRAAVSRDYDVEIALTTPARSENLQAALAGLPGLAGIRPADVVAAAAGRADGLMVVRTYPDGGHGSLSMRPASALPSAPEFLFGTPATAATDAIVNQQAWSLMGRPPVGGPILLAVEGRTGEFVLAGVIRQILTPATAYVSAPGFAKLTRHEDKVAAVRLVAGTREAGLIQTLATAAATRLAAAGIDVEQVLTEATLEAAQSGHVKILIVALQAMAAIMAAVGAIGLGSAQGSSVTERIREFGIMRTIGASGGALMRNILAEGVMIALLSFPLSLLLGLPLGYAIGVLVGLLSFGLALPLTLAAPALGLWLALLAIGAVAASLAPARRAAALTIAHTLTQI